MSTFQSISISFTTGNENSVTYYLRDITRGCEFCNISIPFPFPWVNIFHSVSDFRSSSFSLSLNFCLFAVRNSGCKKLHKKKDGHLINFCKRAIEHDSDIHFESKKLETFFFVLETAIFHKKIVQNETF